MKKIILSVLMLGILLFTVGVVSATTLFEDDFDDGVILNNDWSAAHFEPHDGGTPSVDVYALSQPAAYGATGYSAVLEDDVAIYHEVDTTGYENIEFEYCRKTHSVGTNDRLKVGWKEAPLGAITSSLTYWDNNWNQLESMQSSSWSCTSFSLGSNAEDTTIYIAFFLDNGENDFGKVDEVRVTGDRIDTCELIIDNPIEDQEWYDSEAVNIIWHLEGEGCTPIDRFDVWYEKDGDCNPNEGWLNVPGGQDLAPGDVENPSYPDYAYLWDRPQESGRYCVKVKVSSNGARDISENFYVDLAPPEVHMSVGTPQVGDCDEGAGDCYVNQDTDITLSCTDDDPKADWQSGPDYTEYRYKLNGGTWTDWMLYDDPFSFPEDSNHVLEYKCFDEVGKESRTKEKNFFVDSQAPEITKEVIGPQMGDCPPEPLIKVVCLIEGDCHPEPEECYINGITEIHVNAVDPQPHPVDEVQCEWGYTVNGQTHGSGFEEGSSFVINFPEESNHLLYIDCWDALGNSVRDVETFIVDKTPPVTDIWHEGPYLWGSGPEQYIDGVTVLGFNAVDSEPHPSGVAKTYYRYELVHDDYCWNTNQEPWETTDKEDKSWMAYSEPFGIDEESCHVVEFYSVDNVDKEEEVQTWFVFVDKTAPELFKEVGEPAVECTAAKKLLGVCENNWDWLITMDTPIYLSCADQDPHPSGVDELCWRLTLDGDVVYGHGADKDGWVCEETDEVTLRFHEESEHQLEFYCVDNVEKVSRVDSELFKVQGEEFRIPIHKKWNLISIPFNLLTNNIDEVFSQMEPKGVDIEGVWSYDETGWHVYAPEGPSDLEVIEPGYGYWVLADCEAPGQNDLCGHLEVGGSLLSPGPGTPPSRPLQTGWNLVGHYGTQEKSAYCSLFSLVDTQEGFPRWSALYGYNPISDQFRALDSSDSTNAGRGYWLEMDVTDMYSPATACWGFEP